MERWKGGGGRKVSSSSSSVTRAASEAMPSSKKRGRKKLSNNSSSSSSGSRAMNDDKEESRPSNTIPLKKRKTMAAAAVEEEPPGPPLPEVPEWFKLSVQICLINFYPEGVAVLNNLPSDYETLFNIKPVNPVDHGFADWECMLRSLQFKRHCVVYTEKRIAYCKGFPLPRSAGIHAGKNGVWEIVPKMGDGEDKKGPNLVEEIEKAKSLMALRRRESSASSETDPKESTPSPAAATVVVPAAGVVVVEQPVQVEKIPTPVPVVPVAVLSSCTQTSDDSGNSSEKEEATKNNGPIILNSFSIVNPNANLNAAAQIQIASPDASVVSQSSGTSGLELLCNCAISLEQLKQAAAVADLLEVKSGRGSLAAECGSNFFRRSDVPATWTTIKDFETVQIEKAKLSTVAAVVSVSSARNDEKVEKTVARKDARQEKEIEIVEVVQKSSSSSSRRKEKEKEKEREKEKKEKSKHSSKDRDKEKSREKHSKGKEKEKEKPKSREREKERSRKDRDSRKRRASQIEEGDSSPQPPKLSPQVVFHKSLPERVKERRESNNSASIILPIVQTPYAISQALLADAATKKKLTPEVEQSNVFSVIKPRETTPPRRLSLSLSSSDMVIDINAVAALVQQSCFNVSADVDSSPPLTEDPLSGPQGEESSFMDWKVFPVSIQDLDKKDIRRAIERGMLDNLFQNPDRDPRLTHGIRAEHYGSLKLEKESRTPHDNGQRQSAAANPQNQQSKSSQLTKNEEAWRAISGGSLIINATPLGGGGLSSPPIKEEMNISCESLHIMDYGEPMNQTGTDASNELDNPTQSSSGTSRTSSSGGKSRDAPPIYLEPPIMIDYSETDVLHSTHMWNSIVWKSRFQPDSIPPDRFFESDALVRWRTLSRRLFAVYRTELMHEVQKYEEKAFPSRCDYYLRSSLRMVELDYLTEGQFSDPRDLVTGSPLLGHRDVLFYADFAGAPGGVIEFYGKMKDRITKGFGVTYQKRSYSLNTVPDICPDFFEAFYGKLNSYNGDGNLFSKETVDAFVGRVMKATDGKGVHIVSTVGNVARCVFDDDNDEHWKFQHLAQTLVSLLVLREGGNMAFKMYDLKKSFTVGVVYLLYRCFKSVRITKLNIFAPTSGERVVICLGRRSDGEICEVIGFLQECHKFLMEWYTKDKVAKSKRTIDELIPYAELVKHERFMEYIKTSNEKFKKLQSEELNTCARNLRRNKSIFTKSSYRALVARTIELWDVPLRSNHGQGYRERRFESRNPLVVFAELRVPEMMTEAVETILNEYNLYSIFSGTERWRTCIVGGMKKARGFYMGVDGIPHSFNFNTKEWTPVVTVEFRLPSRTLVYGEITSIFKELDSFPAGGGSPHYTTEEIFTIIDGYVLAGIEIDHLPYAKRICECEKFSIAVSKAFFPRMARLAVTKAFDFTHLPHYLEKISLGSETEEHMLQKRKGPCNNKLTMPVNLVYTVAGLENGYWFNPSGMLFFESGPIPRDFSTVILSRVYWDWVVGMDIPPSKFSSTFSFPSDNRSMMVDEMRPIGSVSAKKIVNFVQRYT